MGKHPDPTAEADHLISGLSNLIRKPSRVDMTPDLAAILDSGAAQRNRQIHWGVEMTLFGTVVIFNRIEEGKGLLVIQSIPA